MKVLFDKKLLMVYLVIIISFAFTGKVFESENKYPKTQKSINVIIPSSSTDYFIYNGYAMGFQYDLLKEFAKEYDYEYNVINESNLEVAFKSLENDESDLIASNLTITSERNKRFNFTTPYDKTRQVLVQRKNRDKKQVIRNLIDLAGIEVFVPKCSSFSARLSHLSEETGNDISITEVKYTQEELAKNVSKGIINFTVCDENIAKVLARINPNLDIKTKISFKQHLAWAVNKNNSQLHIELNQWFEKFSTTPKYAFLKKKFYSSKYIQLFAQRGISKTNITDISIYDQEIIQHSKLIDWDWRLVASLIYQESAFQKDVISWAGAYGLMQLMPQNAKRFNITNKSTTSEQIKAGIEIMKQIDNILPSSISDEKERIKFMLASYNGGIGHVLDARKLAKKYGRDPNIWHNNVDYFMLKKSEKKYYKDPIVKHGYCRGKEPYLYVKNILKRYNHYKNILAENRDAN